MENGEEKEEKGFCLGFVSIFNFFFQFSCYISFVPSDKSRCIAVSLSCEEYHSCARSRVVLLAHFLSLLNSPLIPATPLVNGELAAAEL